jgi:hypothetical protein
MPTPVSCFAWVAFVSMPRQPHGRLDSFPCAPDHKRSKRIKQDNISPNSELKTNPNQHGIKTKFRDNRGLESLPLMPQTTSAIYRTPLRAFQPSKPSRQPKLKDALSPHHCAACRANSSPWATSPNLTAAMGRVLGVGATLEAAPTIIEDRPSRLHIVGLK